MIGNFLGNFETPHSSVKRLLLLFGQLLQSHGLLFTPTSGHTGPPSYFELLKSITARCHDNSRKKMARTEILLNAER